MVDISAAYQDAKFLSDDDLKKELSTPSGMIPGYIIMSEMQDRQALRAGSGGAPSQLSMKDELLAQPTVRQYSKGGIVAQLNPFNAQAQAMGNPKLAGGFMQDAINDQYGGLPPLQPAQAPGAPQGLVSLSSLIPTQSGQLQQPKHYAMGGIASLYRR